MIRGSSPLSAVSPLYLDHLYTRFRKNPADLDESWRCLFGILDLVGETTGTDFAAGLSNHVGAGPGQERLAEAIRLRGHLMADTDPLEPGRPRTDHAAFVPHMPPPAPSPDVLRHLHCGTLALESAHIDDPHRRNWLIEAFERIALAAPHDDGRDMLFDLIRTDELERFLGRKFPTKKRFGAEGAEGIVVLLRAILRQAAASGVTHVVLGTMHRGRLALMTTLLGRSPARLFAELEGAHPFPNDPVRPGDVPYHLGLRTTIETGAGALEVILLANPSHLEAIDPVVLGRARALQDRLGDEGARRVLPLIVHTDAAVVGQGVVAETLQLGAPPGFTTGGTVHVVLNNQIGFTTEPQQARTSRHCTGPWKAIDSCILHLNGDDTDAIGRAARLAVEWRQVQGCDAVVDFVCYRRNGHNEIDEPTFTQPLLYRQVAAHEPVTEATARRMIEAGIVTRQAVDDHAEACRATLADAYAASRHVRINESGYPTDRPAHQASPTGVAPERLRAIADHLAAEPNGLTLHPKMARVLRQRAIGDGGLPWAVAESLALGSLLQDGVDVRLTGQDVVRGAFSHRHLSLVDSRTGAGHTTLSHLPDRKGRLSLHDSPLSEYAVLGFEYGYSLGRPDALTIWEAQFGDFANGAQIVLDQFIAAAEEKWCMPSGLVVLLPHGLEGQGPEHSSARIERFLQMAAGTNMRIVQPSTPANYFHLLRRQVCAAERRPLIVASPKRLLRLQAAVSPLADFAPGRCFDQIVSSLPDGAVRRILLCSGKIAYELEAERARRGADDVAVVRIEELFPLPVAPLLALFRAWPDATALWVQEEPENMGAWSWLDRQLERLRQDAGSVRGPLAYVGRPASGSPAGSFHAEHETDQAAIVARAFEPTPPCRTSPVPGDTP